MKKIFNISKFLPLLLLLVVTSCKKELNLGNLEVTGSLEQPAVDDADAKNYLAYERYIYWDDNDTIYIFSGDDCDPDNLHEARAVPFTPATDPKFGSCGIKDFSLSSIYYAIYPSTCAVIDNNHYSDQINMPTVYEYRNDGNADYSYGRPGMPMVAYVETTAENENLNIDFHSVCGIARIQMFASSTTKTISSIEFEECSNLVTDATCNPISGQFEISGITTNAPTLVRPTSPTTNTKISLLQINQPVNADKLFTFYLPLPALNGATNNITTYYIKATVKFSDDTIAKAFKVDIRRNALSYLKAIDLDGTSNTVQGMVGNGTQLRPFQIYGVDDLVTMRNAFTPSSAKDDPVVKINNIVVSENTYFRLVNSQIELTSANWTAGIPNFKGHFICANGNPTDMGIVNNSNAPIFESITGDGHVEGLYVRGTNTYNGSESAFSPLCAENRGELIDCQNYCTLSGDANLAGICVDNYGTITNAANKAVITGNYTSSHVAGVCLTNHTGATISGYGISAAAVDGVEAAAICHNNQGMVKDCQVTYNNIHLKGKIGGIVYVNNGTIDHCEVVGNVLQTEGRAGGICCINNKLVNGCANGLELLSGRECVGGIVAEQANSAAEIRNCCNIGSRTASVELNESSTFSSLGGIIGRLSYGKVYNCLCNQDVICANATYCGTIVGENKGIDKNIQNCFDGSSMTSKFWGYAMASGMGDNCFTLYKQDFTTQYNLAGEIIGSSETVVNKLNKWTDGKPNYYGWKGTYPSLTITPGSKHRRR